MRVISPSLLERITGRRVISAEPLAGGYRNSNFKLVLDGPTDSLVLRIYEHDPALCQKELDILRLIAGSVPVPEVVEAAPRGLDDFPPYLLSRLHRGYQPLRALPPRSRECDRASRAFRRRHPRRDRPVHVFRKRLDRAPDPPSPPR